VQEQQQPDVSATFTTKRTRPIVIAAICTPLFLMHVLTDDFSYDVYPKSELFGNLVELLLLIAAVRAWPLVVRRPSELRLTPTSLTVKRGDRELTVPWPAVGHIYLHGHYSRPWVVAWLDPSINPDQVPVSRRKDGSYRLFPIGHGRTTKARNAQGAAVQQALKGFGRRWVEVRT
jgi:hypothetical protein